MLRIWPAFWVPVLAAQVVPGKYIVELAGEPADAHASRLARHRGVARVSPVYLMHASLDRALPLRIGFRVIDRSGVPVTTIVPAVGAVTGSGSAVSVSCDNMNCIAVVRLGSDDPNNVFQISAGTVTVQFGITGQ